MASFDPDLARHRLPGGDSFRLKTIVPDFRGDVPTGPSVDGSASQEWRNPAVVIEANEQGVRKEQLMVARQPSGFFLSPTRALAFERRPDEKRAYVSWVTTRQGSTTSQHVIQVNEPLRHSGWTLYQVNYDPRDPSYSGLEAVHDPGVAWVFSGFALICAGVVHMLYVEPRLRRRSGSPTAAQAQA